MRGTEISPPLHWNTVNMISKDIIAHIIEEYTKDTTYYLVDAKISMDNRILVEIDNFDGVSIGFCKDLSKHIESKLDRDVEDFELEVSSAGLTSPFKVLKQYEKNIGNEVEVLTTSGIKKRGILKDFDTEKITLTEEKKIIPEGGKRKKTIQEDTEILFDKIKSTTYIFKFK